MNLVSWVLSFFHLSLSTRSENKGLPSDEHLLEGLWHLDADNTNKPLIYKQNKNTDWKTVFIYSKPNSSNSHLNKTILLKLLFRSSYRKLAAQFRRHQLISPFLPL